MKTKISIILITKNEEKNIKICLESLLLLGAQEIIIVDNGSTDNTLNIIKNIADNNIGINIQTYIHSDWQGFGYQKNTALSYTANDYILSIDADEVVSLELCQSIQDICINNNLDDIESSMYKIQRLNYFCGKQVNYSGWQNDKVIRLFNKKYAKFSDDKVHEKVIFNQNSHIQYDKQNNLAINCINGLLHHYSYTSFSQVLEKIDQYSSLGAEQLYKRNKKSSFITAVMHGISAFIKSFIVKLGFLDKGVGFNIALMNALASYYKYIKLKQIHDK